MPNTADVAATTAARRRRPGAEQIRAWRDEPRVPDAPGPNRTDAVLVAVSWGAALVETALRPDVVWRPVALVVALVTLAALPWRRTHPLAVLAGTFGLTSACTLAAAAEVEPFGLWAMAPLILLPYTLFRWASGRDTLVGLGVMVSTWAISVAADFTNVGEAVGGFVFMMLPMATGALVRTRASVRVEQQQRVRAEERERLARELHDTVAHHMSAVAVQAQAGRTLATTRPEAAVEALAVIEDAASRSLEDLRDMVRSLRTAEAVDHAPLAPRSGLADIEALERFAQHGLEVCVEIVGPRRAVPDAVAGALHRIAQESVTNVVRHATHATRATISVSIDVPHRLGDPGSDDRDPRVVMTVRDDGSNASSRPRAGGFGLVGMSERAALLGGTLEAGPANDGGWTVRCELPLGPAR